MLFLPILAGTSRAFQVEGVGFSLQNNTMAQVGSCLYPNYGPKSDATPFMPSVTVYLHNARAGVLAGNTIYWRCSAYDMDVSDRIVFENNTVVCTEHGVVPHGNSVSGYDWRVTSPHCRFTHCYP